MCVLTWFTSMLVEVIDGSCVAFHCHQSQRLFVGCMVVLWLSTMVRNAYSVVESIVFQKSLVLLQSV
ncbi:MAG TPA: hypothetical protein DCW33_04415 [Proteobacteria bacterium]|nr:hypothetical protein [Pseudomonadota bacterium]